jgi:hypothetical protein
LLLAAVACSSNGANPDTPDAATPAGDAASAEAGKSDAATPEAGAPDGMAVDTGASGFDAGIDAPPPPSTFCATQWPLTTTAAVGQSTELLYTRLWVANVTPSHGTHPELSVEVGYGPPGDSPTGSTWEWRAATYNAGCGGCPADQDEFQGTLMPSTPGDYLWASRVSTGGSTPVYCDRGPAGSSDGWSADDAPRLHVQ